MCPALIFLDQTGVGNTIWKDGFWGSIENLEERGGNHRDLCPHCPLERMKADFPLPPGTGGDGLQTVMLVESLHLSEDQPACILPVEHNWSHSLVRRAHAGCFSSLLEQHLTIRAIELYFSVSVSQPGPSVAPWAAFRANEVVRTLNNGMHPGGFTSEEGLGLIPSTIRETQWCREEKDLFYGQWNKWMVPDGFALSHLTPLSLHTDLHLWPPCPWWLSWYLQYCGEGIYLTKVNLPLSICRRDLGADSSIPEGDLSQKKTKKNQVHHPNFSTSAQRETRVISSDVYICAGNTWSWWN